MEHAEEQQQETRKENEEGETTRPDASPRPSPRHSRDSEWEVLSISSPQSEEVQQLIPPTSRTDQPKVLCGYLKKETTRSVIKQWKQRWVVFDDERCCLYYFNNKTDSASQGSIVVSNATFTYSVENLSRNQFEIRTSDMVYNFQAASQDAMFQWIAALQKKRRRFSERRKKEPISVTLTTNPALSVGLVSESNQTIEEGERGEEEELDPNGVVIDSDLPMCSPAHPSVAESSNLHKIMKHLTRVTVRRQSHPQPVANAANTTNRRSNFFVSIPEDEPQQPESQTATTPQTESDGPRSWRPSMPEWITNKLSRSATRAAEGGDCPKCVEYQVMIGELQADVDFKEREVKDRSEVIEFLREEIKQAQLKDKVRQELSISDSSIPENQIDILTQRDELIHSLQLTLGKLTTENDHLENNLQHTQRECASLKDEIALYKETVTAKDQIVVDLTNQLFALESGGQVLRNPQDAMLPTTTAALEDEICKLKETVEAYKQQNVFLSREIMELHQLRTADGEAMGKLRSELTDQEAEFIRLQSKYFVLLKEAQAPRMEHEAGPDTDLVSQMMQEALDHSYASIRKTRSNSEAIYDPYGFRHGGEDEGDDEEEEKLVQRTIDQQVQQVDESVASHLARWDNFMIPHNGGKDLSKLIKTHELKNLIRGGVPRRYRGPIWRWCLQLHLSRKYVPNLYQEKLKENAGKSSIAINQIELDLLRTLPTNKYYNSPDAPGIAKLRRVLVAYSWYDPVVGYCQGLNRLVAIALLFLEEEYAFWCLVTIVNCLLPPDYYNQTLLGSQTDQRVLRELITEKMPRLSAHLDTCDIDFSLITFNWFHTIFIDNLPVETMLRIWDTFLYEGSKVLFRYAIAIFKHSEESLLSVDNSINIFNRLRTMAQDVSEVQKVTQIAFNDPMMRNFSKKMIQQKRQLHRLQLKFELEKLDKHRTLEHARHSRFVADSRDSDSDDDPDD